MDSPISDFHISRTKALVPNHSYTLKCQQHLYASFFTIKVVHLSYLNPISMNPMNIKQHFNDQMITNLELLCYVFINVFLTFLPVITYNREFTTFLFDYLTCSILFSPGVPLESIRLRFALLQSLNNSLENFFLPLVDLRPSQSFSRSTAALLASARGLIFYDTKNRLLNHVINATALRKPDQAAPEIVLNPLEHLTGNARTLHGNHKNTPKYN